MNDGEEQWPEDVDPDMLRRRRERVALILGGLLLFSLAGLLAYWLRPAQTSADEVPLVAEHAVAQQLHARGALHFSPPAEVQVVPVSAGQYLVRGWVMDVAAGGQSWRYLYTVTVIVGSSEYTVRDVSVMEQY
jgi:hypothetical protein